MMAPWPVQTDLRFIVDFDVTARSLRCQVFQLSAGSPSLLYDSDNDPTNAPNGLAVRGDADLGPVHFLRIRGGNKDTPHFQIDNLRVTADSGPSGVGNWAAY
jgi:hypothetical protein